MSGYIDPTSPALESLATLSQHHPDQSSTYTQLSSLLSSKLYHQLTVSILTFVSNNDNTRTEPSNNYFILFNDVLIPFATKLNPLSLSRIASYVAMSLNDYEASKALLQSLIDEFDKNINMNNNNGSSMIGRYSASAGSRNNNNNGGNYTTAKLFTESKLNNLILKQLSKVPIDESTKASTFENIKSFLHQNKITLNELSNSTETDIAIVHSAYYECSMTFRKSLNPPDGIFYKEAISYLHYTPIDTITPYSELYTLATDLTLSALTGEGVYNFGEVVCNNKDILNVLKGTDNQYLVDLMEASADGNVSALEEIWNKYNKQIHSQPLLVNKMDAVKEKITLLALVNMVFERESNERTLKFVDIADRMKMDVEKVEWVVMRALSLGLIKGSMDQVDQTVDVTWVMPRVLDEANMRNLAARFGEWAVRVSQTREYMSKHVPVTFG